MKIITHLSEIADQLAEGRTGVLHAGPSGPALVGEQLAECSALWPGLELRTFMPLADCPYAGIPEIRTRTLLPGPNLRDPVNKGGADIMRNSLYEHTRRYATGDFQADVLFLQVSPPDKDGRVSLGPAVDFIPEILAQTPFVVAVINPQVPRTGFTIPVSVIDAALHDDRSLPETSPSLPDEVDQQIAANVLTLLGDGITLETGIGSVPEAVLQAVVKLEGITVHTGLINDAIVPLVDSGRLSGPVTTTMAMGTSNFMAWLENNTAVDFKPTNHTHAPDVLAALPKFHAVNGALQVDLNGNVNGERIGERIISCPGGLPDFAQGAKSSDGGKSIIALRSTAGRNARSSIVPIVDCKTLDGKLVDYVVTEHGIAHLDELDADGRATALIAIAHPEHRRELEVAIK